MADQEEHWPYYAVDAPGLTQEDAEVLLAIGRRKLAPDLHGMVVDPYEFHIHYYDVRTVSALSSAVSIALESRHLTADEVIGLETILEDFTLWLDIIVRRE